MTDLKQPQRFRSATLREGTIRATDAAAARTLQVDLTAEEIVTRLTERGVNAGTPRGGLLEKYALSVRPAHQGAVTHSGAVTWLRDKS